jgi:hypothetical protein
MRGQESLSIERRGRWCFKVYKPADPLGVFASPAAWLEQLDTRATLSRQLPHGNPVVLWLRDYRLAVSAWIEAVRPTTADDVDAVRGALPAWIGDVKVDGVIVSQAGPVLIDFRVRAH